MNINFNSLNKLLLPFVFICALAYGLNIIFSLLLAKTGIDYSKKENLNIVNKDYSSFYNLNKKTQIKKEFPKINSDFLLKYELKAIYSSVSTNKGWITLEDKETKSTYILSTKENIEGYTLNSVFKEYVIFEKDEKEYILEILKNNEELNNKVNDYQSLFDEKISVQNNMITIKREFFNNYIKDLNFVWKNLSINEIRKENKIEGFEIIELNKKSIFNKIGLKNGDIIKEVNNKPLNSYAEVLSIHKNINNTKYLNIKVLRNNELVELYYEIN